MIQTNTEYLSNPERVERIVQKFMNLTLGELQKARQTRIFIQSIADEIICKEHLCPEKSMDMSYIEFACLVNNVGDNPKYEWIDEWTIRDSLAEQLLYYKIISSALMSEWEVSIPVRLFLELPLKAFYTYLDNAAATENVMPEFEYIKNHYIYRDDYTIRDFLLEQRKTVNKSWPITERLSTYEERIKKAHKDIGRLLIDSFRVAFPDKFNVDEILDKYRDPDIEAISKSVKSHFHVDGFCVDEM